jgi:hypothetical protein
MDPTVYSKLTSWVKIKELLMNHGPGWVFRGQAGSQWGLCTTLERYCRPLSASVAEDLISRKFKRNAHAYLRSIELPQVLIALEVQREAIAPRSLRYATRPKQPPCQNGPDL